MAKCAASQTIFRLAVTSHVWRRVYAGPTHQLQIRQADVLQCVQQILATNMGSGCIITEWMMNIITTTENSCAAVSMTWTSHTWGFPRLADYGHAQVSHVNNQDHRLQKQM